MPQRGQAPYAEGRRKSGSPVGLLHCGGCGHPSGKANPRARAGPPAADTRRLPSGKQAAHRARPASPGAGVRQALAGGAPQVTQRRGCSALVARDRRSVGPM
eukprot:8341498-Alexandrium_andersonii.AAC.1